MSERRSDVASAKDLEFLTKQSLLYLEDNLDYEEFLTTDVK